MFVGGAGLECQHFGEGSSEIGVAQLQCKNARKQERLILMATGSRIEMKFLHREISSSISFSFGLRLDGSTVPECSVARAEALIFLSCCDSLCGGHCEVDQ